MLQELTKINDFYFIVEKSAIDEKEKVFHYATRCKKGLAEKKKRSFNLGAGHHVDANETESLAETEPDLVRAKPGTRDDSHVPSVVYTSHSSSDSGRMLQRRTTKSKMLRFLKFKDEYSRRKRERAVIGYISSLQTLLRYRDLNYTGFKKILKKYDKNCGKNITREIWPLVRESYFCRSTRVELALKETKALYRRQFARDNSKKAKSVFHRISRRDKADQVSSFFAGAFIAVSLFIFSILGDDSTNLYHSINLFTYGATLFGLCMIIFKKTFINYDFIFNFDICSSMSISRYFFLVSVFIVVHNIGFYLYTIHGYFSPILIMFIQILILLQPLDILFKASRLFFLSM